jgi:hypothetical protein
MMSENKEAIRIALLRRVMEWPMMEDRDWGAASPR